MSLFEETEKFDIDKSLAVSIIAEDDETVEERLPQQMTLFHLTGTHGMHKRNKNTSIEFRKPNPRQVHLNKRVQDNNICKLHGRVKCSERKLMPQSTEALLRRDQQLNLYKTFMKHTINTRRVELKVQHSKILMMHLNLKEILTKYGRLYLLMKTMILCRR